ncbi:MAG: hypothetical protein NCW75_04860 [Phycisphaera sp.]|nr:MAG: hypothetical protein NCW75_04860 [Phycisphaera sp.]
MTCTCAPSNGIGDQPLANEEEVFELVIPRQQALVNYEEEAFLGFGKKNKRKASGKKRQASKSSSPTKRARNNPWKHGFEDMQSMESEYDSAMENQDSETSEPSFVKYADQQLRSWAGKVKTTSSLRHVERENHRLMSLRYVRMGVIAERIERLVAHYTRSGGNISTGAAIYAGQYLSADADLKDKERQVKRFMKESEKIGIRAWNQSATHGGTNSMSKDAWEDNAIRMATGNFRSDPILALIIAAPDQLAEIDAVAKYKGMVEQIQRLWRQKYERYSGESYKRVEKIRR